MDRRATYTKFPNLYDVIGSDQQHGTFNTAWPIALPSELLILSWAVLLQSYTGTTDPVFLFDGIPIQFDVAHGSWAEVEMEDTNEHERCHTSLNLHMKPAQKCTLPLELHYDGSSGHIALLSACCVPESFLPQILSQLQHVVSERALAGDIVFSDDRGRLVSVANFQRKVLSGPRLLHHLVHASSDAAVAIDYLSPDNKRVQLSYKVLDRLSDRLARRIASALATQHGKSAGETIIPVQISQSPELYVAQIAILKSGATFCPLMLDMPPERLAFILKDVGARVVVTTDDCRRHFLNLDPGLHVISSTAEEDGERQLAKSFVPDPHPRMQHADSLAYVMYTSGSTGLPKGVGVSHRAVTQALLAHDEYVPSYQRFLQFAAPTFDVSVFEIFFTLYRGATLVCCHRENMLNDLTGILRELSVDAAEFTPTVIGTLLRSWDAVPSLKLLLTIGEILPRSVIEQFEPTTHGGRRLLPMYGPTEASIHCTVAPNICGELKAGFIGLPFPTVSAFIVEEDKSGKLRTLPVGHVGELAVAGQLARGYINRAEQTEAAFVDLPGYGLVYRTGDRGRLLPSGNLECLGRIASGQVKIRGQRVELGEIEQIICQVDNIRFAVASIVGGNLIVFCLFDDETSISASQEAIRERCKAWLPLFMRPTDIVPLTKEVPRLPSGKVDKKSLEDLYLSQNVGAKADAESFASECERLVADVIQAELGIHVETCEDLWSKGLNSLHAIRIASKLRDRGSEIAVTDILSADTVATISKTLERMEATGPPPVAYEKRLLEPFKNVKEMAMSELDAAQASDVEDIVECSKLQLAMLSESLAAKHINSNLIKLKLAESVSVKDVLEAFCRLAQLNDILRSGFVQLPHRDLHFARIIWKTLDPNEQIRYRELNMAKEYTQAEAQDLTLLRPLRLGICSSETQTMLSVYVHHALYDGWSWDLIMADLNLMICGENPPQRPQFEQFVQCENAFLSSQKATSAQDYWGDRLKGINPTPLPVLTNTKTATGNRTFGRTITTSLSLLDVMSRELRISRHSIPSAAFATVLHLYCGTHDVVFGSVSSGRTVAMPGVERVIGPCISTLPVRINFSHLRTVSDLVVQTHQLHYDLLKFGQLPLRDIKKAAGFTYEQTLFDTLFVWQEGLVERKNDEAALSVTDQTDSLQYALVLEIEPWAGKLYSKATYKSSIISTEQVELFISQFDSVVEFYCRSSTANWRDAYDHIQPQDLSIANADFRRENLSIGISATVDRLAREDPTRIAVQFVDDLNSVDATMKVSKMSYRTLSEEATLVARHLLSRGTSANDLICVLMSKSIQLYVSILGVLKAGAAYVVIDPQAPQERTHRIIESARCRHCLTERQFVDHEVSKKIDSILLFCEIQQCNHSEILLPPAAVTDIAYAVFTSGTTGIPKGVLVTRQNILSNLDVLSRMYPSAAGGGLLQACSPAFDVSVFEILYAWHMGMRLCAASNDLLFRDIERFINLLNITHLSLTPSVAALVRPTNVPNVQMLVTAGEAVTSKVFHHWAGRGLYQGYGPSETTNICSINSRVSASDHVNNIGKPLSSTSMFISSSDTFRPLPKGALGEIWIGGNQVGQGYLNDVDLTAQKFIDHPEYGRLYRSGDFGRMLPNGMTLFHGRHDEQVKLRGQRIELGEIEHALMQLPIVADSTCLLIQGSEQTPNRLVAYLSLTSNLKSDVTHYVNFIFDELQSVLPAYMMPDYLIHMDEIPLTSQGKTDRKALKQRFLNAGDAKLKMFPRNEDLCVDRHFDQPDEIKVAQAVAYVTGTPLSVISSNTSFFALGLDSISCVSLCKALLEAGFGHVNVSVVLQHASVAKLVRRLQATPSKHLMESGNRLNLRHIFGEEWQQCVKQKYAEHGFLVSKILPCTPLQQAMLSQAEGGSQGAYQNQLAFSVFGDIQRLCTAWSTCIAAHEILRTGFILTTSNQYPYAQIVLDDFAFSWNDEKQAAGDNTDEQFMMPPYSFYVEKQSKPLPSRLILRIHHALYDGQAISLLLQDVQRVYLNSSIGAAISLEPYLQYMVDLDEGEADEFWRAHLANYQPKLLSRPSMERESQFSFEGVRCHSSCTTSPQALAESCKQFSVTPLSLLQLTWVRLLTHYSNDLDICFGTVYSGRNLPVRDVEKVVGPCFNTLPVRAQVGKHETNEQVAKKLRNQNLAALRFQPSSYRLTQRNQGGTRLFDTLVLLQTESVRLDSSVWTLEDDSGHMKFPLMLEITPDTRLCRLELRLHAEPGLLSRGEAQTVLKDFEHLLEHTVRYPSALAIDCSIVGSEKPLLLTCSPAAESTLTADNLSECEIDADWSSCESYICEVLRKVSGGDLFGLTRHTTIFHLGFDSINAIQIAAALRRDGYKLTSGDVLEAATVPKIASICKESGSGRLDDNELFDFDIFSKHHVLKVCRRLSIAPEAVEEIRPCTPFQCGVLADFVRSQGKYYLNHVEYELADSVRVDLLKSAWELISSKHEILRTGFVSIDDLQSPFAMILYSSGSSQLPWWESDAAFVQDGAEYALSVLDSLHKPPWRLSIKSRGAQKVMHLSMLHAIYDARSLELLLAEVAAAYRGERLPRTVPIKPCLSGILLKSSNHPTYNASAPDVDVMRSTKFPNLHSHHLRDRGFCTIEDECSFNLGRLQASCRKAGVTMQVAGQCAFARLLSAYSGETVNTFGVVVSGRSGENEDEAVVFPCISTLPVSLNSESITNRTLLETAGRCNMNLLKNPFSSQRVLPATQRELFDSLFVYQNPLPARTSPPWKVIAEDSRANYTVSVELITSCHDTLQFRLTFRNQVIPVEQCRLLLKQLNSLLLDTLEHPDHETSQFIPTDRDLVSIAPARDPIIDTQFKYLHQFVEISAQKLPDKVAFEFVVGIVGEAAKTLSWTYMELNADSNKIAHMLQQNAAIPGDVIGFCFDKCPEASLTMLGILKAGCAFVVLDPSAPDSRKKFILKDSGCRILCTTQDKAASLALVDNLQLLCVDKLLKQSNWPCTTVALPRELVADDVCYCLYTSGTTGTPKGCLITHGNIVQFIVAFQRLFAGHWDVDSRFLQFASFHFDVSVMEQFWSWSVGICVTSAPRDLLFEDLPAAIRALRITHLDLTPSLAPLLTPKECPSLCRGAFITGGEQLRQDIIDTWGEERVIYNGYGPSEVTIGCTMYPRIPISAKPSNIGLAYDNVGAYVLGTYNKLPVLRGGIGELCVSGPLVGKGYLNRPELTAEKFEYLDQLQERVYHTGDLVRLLHDGSFAFIGRSDGQVKLRGQRIEIDEINHIVRGTSQSIKEVTTMLLKYREELKEQLVAFIASSESQVNADHTAIDFSASVVSMIQRIRKACCDALPAYMVPTYIVPITSMPLSTNNKVDNNSLQGLFGATAATELQQFSAQGVSSRDVDSSVMNKVIGIISKTISLSKDAVGPFSQLFELGFDSISVILLSRLLKRAGFHAASPSLIMQNPVLADLVASLTESDHDSKTQNIPLQAAKQDIASFARRHGPAAAVTIGISLHDIQLIAPCTSLQQGMIARTLNSTDAVYFSTFIFALDMTVNAGRLEAAWRDVERENEILRTLFLLTEEGYAQVVLKSNSSPSINVQQFVVESEDECKDVIKRDFIRWSEHSGNLENKLWAVAIYHTPKRTLMTLHIFHALYDGISLGRMLEEVACKYIGGGCAYPRPTFHDILPLGPLLSPAGSQNFWTKNLSAITLLDLPWKCDADDAVLISSDFMPFENAKKVQQQLNVTEAAVLQACWLMSLEKKFQIIPTVGTVVSGRNLDIDGIENVIGPLFNTVPCQVEIGALKTLADLVKACHSFNVKAIPYQQSPLSSISKWLGRTSTQPLFDSLFVFQKEIEGLIESHKLWTQIDSQSRPDYPLALEVEKKINGSLACKIVALRRYLCREEVQELLDILKDTIEDVLKDPHQSLTFQRHEFSQLRSSNDNQSQSTEIIGSEQMADHFNVGKGVFEWDSRSSLMRSEISKLSASELEDITPSTSLFELGLDSIDAIKLCARLKAADVFISVNGILQAGCIARMVETTSGAKAPQGDRTSPSFQRVKEDLRKSLRDQGVLVDDYENVLPVTPLQEGMLANYKNYYSQDLLMVVNEVDDEKLTSAWRSVVSTHDILRTSFVEVFDPKSASIYAQLVSRDVNFECYFKTCRNEKELHDLLASQRAEAESEGIKNAVFHLTFVDMGSDRLLIIGMPHAIYDGWSINLLHEDVARCYSELECQRPSYEPVLDHISAAVSQKSRSFWKKGLSGLHTKSFPSSPAEDAEKGTTNRRRKSSKLQANQATSFCRANGVTLQSLGLTCWAFVLAYYLKSRDICFGVVLAGRDIEAADRMMFPTMNTVPFRIFLVESKLEMVRKVHKLSIDIAEYQHFPLRQAKSMVHGSVSHLFDTLFIYQKRPSQSEQLKPLYKSVGSLSNLEYPVNVEMELLHDTLVWRAACNEHFLNERGTQELLGRVDDVLVSIVESFQEPAFASSSNGISICGLPTFNNWTDGGSLQGGFTSVSKDTDVDQSWILPNEEVISEVLAEATNIERQEITGGTSLFHLGLDSISAIKVSSALKRRSISLPVSEMLKALTVKRMAKAAQPVAATEDRKLANKGKSNVQWLDQACIQDILEQAGIHSHQIESVSPCTAGQEFFLGEWQASAGRLFYPEFHYRIHRPLIDRLTIDTAWQRLVQAVPMLRTTFLSAGARNMSVLQVTLKDPVNPILWIQDQHEGLTNKGSALHSDTQPPVMLLATRTATAVLLNLKIHHALYDGVSLPGIMRAFRSFCNTPCPAAELGTDFSAYLAYLHQSTAKSQQKTFWTSYLDGFRLPQSRTMASFAADRVQLFKNNLIDDLSLIKKQLKRSGISFQALFFAVYASVHIKSVDRRATTLEDINELVVGAYLANRSHDHKGLSRLLAPTVNVVPLRIAVRPELSLLESARAVQDDLRKVGSIENYNVSLSEIHEWTGVKIDCFLNFLNLPDMEWESARADDEVIVEEIEPDNRLQSNKKRQEPPAPFANGVPSQDDSIYLPSIDIEAAVRDGALDVGVFAPRDLLDRRGAEELLDELRSSLLSCGH